jgi:hypothetical protein
MSAQLPDWSDELRQWLFALDDMLARGPSGARTLRLACVALAVRLPIDAGDEPKPVAHLGEAVAEGVLTLETAREQCWRYSGNWRIANTVLARDDELAKTLRKTIWLDQLDRQAWVIDTLRCVVGNPFRPVAFEPAWRSETAVSLAAGIYEERAFDRLPVLADALEEAGCDDAEVLAHCRGPGPHARGCWVVDGVLGKS